MIGKKGGDWVKNVRMVFFYRRVQFAKIIYSVLNLDCKNVISIETQQFLITTCKIQKFHSKQKLTICNEAIIHGYSSVGKLRTNPK